MSGVPQLQYAACWRARLFTVEYGSCEKYPSGQNYEL